MDTKYGIVVIVTECALAMIMSSTSSSVMSLTECPFTLTTSSPTLRSPWNLLSFSLDTYRPPLPESYTKLKPKTLNSTSRRPDPDVNYVGGQERQSRIISAHYAMTHFQELTVQTAAHVRFEPAIITLLRNITTRAPQCSRLRLLKQHNFICCFSLLKFF